MRILLISKSFIVCNSLSELFIEIVDNVDIDTISNNADFEKYNFKNIDFIFIDINNHILKELEIIELLKNKNNTKIMIMDFNKDINFFMKAVRYGVDGYIVDIEEKDEFIFRLNRIIKGKKYYDIDLLKSIINMDKIIELSRLTEREKEVISLLSDGLNNNEIGEALHISGHTAKKHVSSIFSKLNLKNRKEVIIYMKENYLRG